MVRVRLISAGSDGTVRLIACDENGSRLHNGNLIQLTPNGRIERFAGINPDFGFQLDENRRILIREI